MKTDIHGFIARLKRVKSEIEKPPQESDWSRVSKHNREKLLEYYNHLSGKGTSEGRILKYLYTLKTIEKILGKNFEDAAKSDIERILAQLRTMKNPKTKTLFTPNTMKDFKVVLKVFYGWLRGYKNPVEVGWYSCSLKSNEETIKEVFRHKDLIALLESIPDVRYKALFSVIYETAMRPEEALSLVWNDIQDVKGGKMVVAHGKTGARPLYCFWSAKYLIRYMNTHPNAMKDKKDANMPLWLGISGRQLSYSSINNYFHNLVNGSDVQFKENPSLYILRRTRLTELLKRYPEAIVKLVAGHTKSSNTLGKHYNALTSEDVYDKLAEEAGVKTTRIVERLKSDLTECPVCHAQIDPNQSHCVECMTPLKADYARQVKALQQQYDNFMSNPKNKELIMQFIEYMQTNRKTD